MTAADADLRRGLATLRLAVACVLAPQAVPAGAQLLLAGDQLLLAGESWLLSEAVDYQPAGGARGPSTGPSGGSSTGPSADAELPCSSEADQAEASRLIGLVELARGGDTEAFGMLYDHYHSSVYRFIYYRVGTVAIAEDLTAETFFRALRSMGTFRWQGKDFGAWLTTIARNLTADHYKAGRTRLEYATEDMSAHDAATEGPENAVLEALTNEVLLDALHQLPTEQQECLVLRFLQGRSIAETAGLLDRSEGAVKQLQLRAVRNLAKLLPEGIR